MSTIIRERLSITSDTAPALVVGSNDDAHQIRRIMIGRESTGSTGSRQFTGASIGVYVSGQVTATATNSPSLAGGFALRSLVRPVPSLFLTTYGLVATIGVTHSGTGFSAQTINAGTASKALNAGFNLIAVA